jgi:hypothetical protein
MKKSKLTQERILKVIELAGTISECLRDLYKEILPVKWDDIKIIRVWPQVNRKTGVFILDEMHKKWDPITCNMLWLNKGFSSSHDELKDWEVAIPDDCYELIGPEGIHIPDLNDFTAGFAKVEVEEIGVDPDEFRQDAEIEYKEKHHVE